MYIIKQPDKYKKTINYFTLLYFIFRNNIKKIRKDKQLLHKSIAQIAGHYQTKISNFYHHYIKWD